MMYYIKINSDHSAVVYLGPSYGGREVKFILHPLIIKEIIF